jgi:hypothetical protein
MGRSALRATDERGETAPELAAAELERARAAFRGSLETSRAWRAFTLDTRHHNQTYWSLLSVLFVEPGLNRTTLIERVITYAAVSRSTAERAIREARESGYVVDRPAGAEVRYFLSDRLLAHCVRFFREHMDLERLIENLGYGPASAERNP